MADLVVVRFKKDMLRELQVLNEVNETRCANSFLERRRDNVFQ